MQARASASESYQDYALTPEKANDGRDDTRWSGIPGHNAGVWYELDWDQAVPVGLVVVRQYDRFTFEWDLQAWDEAAGDWRTLQHFGRPGERLPKIVLARFEPVSTTRLRIGNITNGPSFDEVEVYAEPFSEPPVLTFASDLQGNAIGMVTDRWGAAPVEGAEVSLSGGTRRDPWTASGRSDAHGLVTLPLPVRLRGPIEARATTSGSSSAITLDAADFSLGLTPMDPKEIRRGALGGRWRFAADPPEDFWSPEYDDSGWSLIPMPAHWEMQGFHPKDGVGGYRLHMLISESATGGGRQKLRFDGVYSGAEVWMNGVLLARHEGGFTPFELDISEQLHHGDNVLAVRVREHTLTSDELDRASQYADFPLGGILRPVSLLLLPELHIAGLQIVTHQDAPGSAAMVRIRATIVNESDQPVTAGSLRAMVSDLPYSTSAYAPPASFTLGAWERVEVALEASVAQPRTWDAEHPNLYSLELMLRADSERTQRLEQRFGFRQTEVRGPELLINGAPVKLRGTCHHDSDPLLGRAVTPERTREDLQLMREANLNALRSSHYPPDPGLLDVADELGLYVEDEAPFCWVGASDDLRNTPRILQLTAELVTRDRNHPSVFLWSLCNESQFGYGFERSHEWVRAHDPARPCSAATSAWLELATLHNPISVARIDENEGLDRPLLFDESLCIYQGIFNDVAEMWVDPGIRDYYAQPLAEVYARFQQCRATQGSFIWCFADDLFCVPGRGVEFGRGGTQCDFLSPVYGLPGRGIVGDAPWGIVDGWRRRKPEFWITKKLHSPVKIAEGPLPLPEPGQLIHVPVENQYDFTNLSELSITGLLGVTSAYVRADVPPHTRGVLEIRPVRPPQPGELLDLKFEAGGQLVDEYRLPFVATADPGPPGQPLATGTLRILEEDNLSGAAVRIAGADFDLAIDRGSGRVRRCVVAGRPLLLELPSPHILPTAAPLAPLPQRGRWSLQGLDVQAEGDEVVVRERGAWPDLEGELELRIRPDGQMQVHSSFQYTGPELWAREVGLHFSVPKDCDLLSWRRDAEWSVYPEDHIGRPAGRTRAHPEGADTVPPQRPWSQDDTPMGCNDFRSSKRRIRWAAIGCPDGPCVEILSDGTQALRASVESDRIAVHVNDFYGGTNAGWWEWESNYGKGRRLQTGERLESTLRLQLAR